MVIDGVPESITVGLTLHTASVGVSAALAGSIFVAAIPWAIGIAAALLAGGIVLGSVLLRFSLIVVIGAVFSAVWYSLLVASPTPPSQSFSHSRLEPCSWWSSTR